MKRISMMILLILLTLTYCSSCLSEQTNPALEAAQLMSQTMESMTDLVQQETEGHTCVTWVDNASGTQCVLRCFADETEAQAHLDTLTEGSNCRVLQYVLQLDATQDEEILAAYRAALTEAAGVDYVVNENTNRFHAPACFSVNEMIDKNRTDFIGERQELIDQDYKPCERCNP